MSSLFALVFLGALKGAGERTAQHAWERSCYFNIDYKVDENETVYGAVRRMSAHNVGCLIVTTDGQVCSIDNFRSEFRLFHIRV